MACEASSIAEESDLTNSSRYSTTSVTSHSVGGRSAASVRLRQLNPNRRNEGFSCVDSCGVLRYAHTVLVK